MMFLPRFFFALLLTGSVLTAAAAPPKIKTSLGLGYFYSEGTYRNKDTSVLKSLPVFLKIQRGLSSIKVSGSLYHFKREDAATEKNKSLSGWGSRYFSAKQLFKSKRLVHYIDLEGKVNTPVPNASIGLGASSYGFKLSSTAYYWVSKNWFTVSIAYRWRNNELRDTFSTALSVSRTLSKAFNAGAILAWEQATQKISSNRVESTFHLTWKAHKSMKYTFYYIKGFNDLKLNWATGMQVTYSW